MRLFDLFEAAVPPTSYGYWITPDGQYVTVGFQDHDEVIRTVANTDIDDALLNGWIRVITRPVPEQKRLIVDMYLGRPGARAISALRRIAASDDFDRFEVELGHANQTTDMEAWKSFDGRAAFSAYVARAAAKRSNITEGAAPPATEYGYWIDPQGNYYAVPFQQHWRVIREITLKTLGYPMTNHNAMREGWIRVIDAADGELSVEVYAHCISARALSALRTLAKDPTIDTFVVSVHEADRTTDIGYGKSFTELRPFLQYMQQVRQPRGQVDEPLLSEAHVPPSDYGYWIKPDGEMIPVGDFGHESELRRQGFEMGVQAYQRAFAAGWVRLVTAPTSDVPTMNIQFRAGTLTLRSISAVKAIAREGEFYGFAVDVQSNYSIDRYACSKWLTNLAGLVSFLQEHRAPRASERGSS